MKPQFTKSQQPQQQASYWTLPNPLATPPREPRTASGAGGSDETGTSGQQPVATGSPLYAFPIARIAPWLFVIGNLSLRISVCYSEWHKQEVIHLTTRLAGDPEGMSRVRTLAYESDYPQGTLETIADAIADALWARLTQSDQPPIYDIDALVNTVLQQYEPRKPQHDLPLTEV